MDTSDVTYHDFFCGAGGFSLGAKAAGARGRMAINHWKRAIETHNANFPDMDHHCADISQMNPRYYPQATILLASPECTNHSLAKGVRRKRVGDTDLLFPEFGPEPDEAAERSRATMWDVPRFAEVHRYRQVFVENVPDAKKWEMYEAWLHAMRCLGYEHREVFLNSMVVRPVPQSRDRMYVVFWRKGDPAPDLDIRPTCWCWSCEERVEGVQTWKNPSRPSGKYKQQYVYTCPKCHGVAAPFAEAAWTAIDWSIKGERIGDRKKPLAAATLARIRAGIEKYWRAPGVVDLAYDGMKVRTIDDPLFAQTARATLALYEPFIAELHGTSGAKIVSDPLMGIAAGGNHHALVMRNYQGGAEMTTPIDETLRTITSVDHHSLIVPTNGGRHGDGGHKVRSGDEPFLTQTADLGRGLVTPPLTVKVAAGTYERAPGKGGRVRSVDEVLATQTGTLGDALFSPPLMVDLQFAYKGHGSDRTKPITLPLSAVTTAYTLGLLTPAGGTWNDTARPADEVMSALTTREALGLARIDRSFLQSYYSGSDILRHTTEPMAGLTAQDRHGLVEMPEPPAVEDCSFRMLEPHEIGRGMAFPDDYLVTGNKREKVRQYGNAVTPPVTAELVRRGLAALEKEGKHAA